MVKKAQIKIQQTAFMLIALTLFFVLVGLFFLSFKLSGLREKATTLDEKNAIILSSKISNYPEFSCEEAYGSKRVNCIDSDKLMAFVNFKPKYSNFWEISGLEIRKIYPKQSEIICSSSNYPNCTYFKIFSGENSGPDYTSFVSLCRKESFSGAIYDKCELAKIIVSYKIK
jgi:hypothetical protein